MTSNNSKAAARAQKAAELRAEQERQERRRRMLTIGGVGGALALLVAGIIGFTVWQQNEQEKDIESAASAPSEHSIAIGPEDAPHEVVIYEDFLCPFCRDLEAETHEELAALAADGKVRVEYRPFDLLHSGGIVESDYPVRATNAFAVVLEESGPEVAKKLHDILFAQQPPEDDESKHFTDDELVDLAVEAGADETDVRPGIEGLEQEAWVDGATREAEEAGVNSTPTVLLDGELFTDGRTVEELADNLLGELE